MTYNVGQVGAAADFINFRGLNSPALGYANVSAATNKIAAIIGVGYGSRGYGQTNVVINSAISGSMVEAGQWNQLFAAMGVINTHTGLALVMPSNVSTSNAILAYDGSSGRPNVATLISSLDTSRLAAAVGQMAVTSALNNTRNTSWNTMVYHEFTVTFTSENAARYFFNSGGRIYLAGSRTGGSVSVINTTMTNLLSGMGTIIVGGAATTYTGSGGTTFPIGYFNLISTYQNMFITHGNVGGYTSLGYTVRAKTENVNGVNGGNGTVIRFQAIFETGLPPDQILDGTLTSSISQLKATGGVLTIAAPSYATTSGL